MVLNYISHETNIYKYAYENKNLYHENAQHLLLQIVSYSPHCSAHICSTHSKFATYTPNLLHPLQICSARSLSDVRLTFLHYHQYKTKTYTKFFCQTQINIHIRYCPHPLRSLILHIHCTPVAHSSTSLHSLIHSIRQRRKIAHETVSISASPSTVPVFKFKSLHYAPHQKRQLCVCYSGFQSSFCT